MSYFLSKPRLYATFKFMRPNIVKSHIINKVFYSKNKSDLSLSFQIRKYQYESKQCRKHFNLWALKHECLAFKLSSSKTSKNYCNRNHDHMNCWSCNESNLKENFCINCGCIQPLNKNLNYFEILGLNKSFSINKKELVKTYRQLQSKFHPDKFSTKSNEEHRLAEEQSSAVNKAYNTLINPMSRGEYMLKEAGHALSEGEITMDPEFLMEIMEINETLANVEDAKTVKIISDKNKEIMDMLIREAESSFNSNEMVAAKSIVAKLKYYKNIYEKVKEYETKHGIFYE